MKRARTSRPVCDCNGSGHVAGCWARPLRPMPFERSGFEPSKPSTVSTHGTGGLTAWLNKVRKEELAKADDAHICDCGAANAHDVHAPNCWARPLPALGFERKGFKPMPKPLRYKKVRASATRWFASGVQGGAGDVLPLTHALFRGGWLDDEGSV